MLLGTFVYFMLWTIDYRNSSPDAELLRRQFDLASREAMDESADWRRRYDAEVEKAGRCSKNLNQLQNSVGESGEASRSLNKKLELLQKENMDLLERVELLKQELEAEKLRCSGQ